MSPEENLAYFQAIADQVPAANQDDDEDHQHDDADDDIDDDDEDMDSRAESFMYWGLCQGPCPRFFG